MKTDPCNLRREPEAHTDEESDDGPERNMSEHKSHSRQMELHNHRPVKVEAGIGLSREDVFIDGKM